MDTNIVAALSFVSRGLEYNFKLIMPVKSITLILRHLYKNKLI
jgi:hypothetical protein